MDYKLSNSKPRVLVAMSGGVDSSVAAAVLKEQGYDVIGCTMQVWDYTKNTCDITSKPGEVQANAKSAGTCCSSVDVDDARAVADQLGIPFYVINCEDKFQAYVIDQFLDDYMEGKTPIPCVNCNTFLKFDHLYKKMKELGCDYLATGHYAQKIKTEEGKTQIYTSSDTWKDQTYFLFTLKPEIIDHLLFPVGTWTKPELRKYAEDKEIGVAQKKDSTGICFIGKSGYKKFIEDHVADDLYTPGDIKKFPSGKVLGQHSGIHNFTYGQRKQLGVSSNVPLYVIKTDASNGDVWLGEEESLYSSEAYIENTNWLDSFSDEDVLDVKVRFQHKGAPAKLKKEGQGYKLVFESPQRAITPGQAAVVYRNSQLLGGGWIR